MPSINVHIPDPEHLPQVTGGLLENTGGLYVQLVVDDCDIIFYCHDPATVRYISSEFHRLGTELEELQRRREIDLTKGG